MRRALWPGDDGVDRPQVLEAALQPAGGACVLLAVAGEEAVGFAEARRRAEYVNGTTYQPSRNPTGEESVPLT